MVSAHWYHLPGQGRLKSSKSFQSSLYKPVNTGILGCLYMNVLPGKPDDIPLSSHVRKTITTFLFNELEERKGDCC